MQRGLVLPGEALPNALCQCTSLSPQMQASRPSDPVSQTEEPGQQDNPLRMSLFIPWCLSVVVEHLNIGMRETSVRCDQNIIAHRKVVLDFRGAF